MMFVRLFDTLKSFFDKVVCIFFYLRIVSESESVSFGCENDMFFCKNEVEDNKDDSDKNS